MIESAINFLKENESRVHWYSFEGKIVTFFRCFCLYERHVHSKQTGIAIWRGVWRFKPFKHECNAIHSFRWMIFSVCQLK